MNGFLFWLHERLSRHRPWLGMVAALLFVASSVALARPGGGGSFSGGSGGGGGGGGGDDFIFDLIWLVLQLVIQYPALGVPLLIVTLIIVIARANLSVKRQGADWSTAEADDESAPSAVSHPPGRGLASPRAVLETIRDFDGDFSVVLFEDFVYSLYAQAQYARGTPRLEQLSAYLSPDATAQLGSEAGTEVKTVVIGAMRHVSTQGIVEGSAQVRVVVEIEANYTVSSGGREQAWYVRDMWRLMRLRSARSKPPRRARVLTCPNCGAPLDAVMAGKCSHCGKAVATGEFDWVVEGIYLQDKQTRGPMLTGEQAADQGLYAPTIVDPNASSRLSALSERDAQFTWGALRLRLNLIFTEFQLAWSARDLAPMRPFLSDNLFESETFWIDAYQRQRLRNVTENARISRTQVARVTSDKYFDAITVRLFATGLDYTLTDDGNVVAGSRTREKPYSEYWTLIRAASATGTPRSDKKCPNCGAPLKINMAGVCEYCQAKVTSGDFDWVLSRIEQASAYGG